MTWHNADSRTDKIVQSSREWDDNPNQFHEREKTKHKHTSYTHVASPFDKRTNVGVESSSEFDKSPTRTINAFLWRFTAKPSKSLFVAPTNDAKGSKASFQN